MGEIRLFPYNFVPKGWLPCDGRLLSTQTNAALFSLLGTQFGSSGNNLFALPDLRGRTALAWNSTGTLTPA
ncbi:phage tail protein [Pseudomonas qingdaonensis]|nr:phage tail protein [Pseudomonas qingdaonensis]